MAISWDRGTPLTRLMNFPMQSNGAVMLRQAVKAFAFETDLDVVCTLHDAVYVVCREEEADQVMGTMRTIMARAVDEVIGPAVPIDVGFNVYTHEGGYRDKRGDDMLDRVRALLEDILLPKAA